MITPNVDFQLWSSCSASRYIKLFNPIHYCSMSALTPKEDIALLVFFSNTPRMCNRYGHWATLTALRERAKAFELELAISPELGNLEPQPNIYADQDAPILTNTGDGLILRRARWGLPPFRERDAKGRLERPRNNIRKVDFWRQRYPDLMLEPAHRCLVPFSAFAEPTQNSTWFAVPSEEVAFFAGVCMNWSGERLKAQSGKARRKREKGDWLLYSILTTEANSVVSSVHPDAMPVVLTEPQDCRDWLAGGENIYHLQRPLSESLLSKCTRQSNDDE